MASLLQHARRVAFDSHKRDHASGSRIKRLSRSAPFSLFVEALEADGCVIVKDFTNKAALEEAGEEVRPWLEGQENGITVGGMTSLVESVYNVLIHLQLSRERRGQSPA